MALKSSNTATDHYQTMVIDLATRTKAIMIYFRLLLDDGVSAGSGFSGIALLAARFTFALALLLALPLGVGGGVDLFSGSAGAWVLNCEAIIEVVMSSCMDVSGWNNLA